MVVSRGFVSYGPFVVRMGCWWRGHFSGGLRLTGRASLAVCVICGGLGLPCVRLYAWSGRLFRVCRGVFCCCPVKFVAILPFHGACACSLSSASAPCPAWLSVRAEAFSGASSCTFSFPAFHLLPFRIDWRLGVSCLPLPACAAWFGSHVPLFFP